MQRLVVGLDQPKPDGGHAQRQRGRLLGHQIEQIVRVQVRAGEDHLHAHHHRAIRDAPAVGVEHGRDGQHHVGAAQAPEVAHAGHQRVQDGGAVRIDHALRLAGGARRVAHADRVVFVVRHVLEGVRVGGRQQRFVIGEPGRHRRAAEGEHDDFLEFVQVRKLLVQRQQHVVDDEEAVLGVARDPADFFRRQAQVERVHHAAGGGNAEVGFQVGVVVPAQRGHALSFLQPQLKQRRRQGAGAAVVLGVAVALEALVGQARDDVVAVKDLPRALQQVVE